MNGGTMVKGQTHLTALQLFYIQLPLDIPVEVYSGPHGVDEHQILAPLFGFV